jgi:hypothetical protein
MKQENRLGKQHQVIYPQDKSNTYVMPSDSGSIITEAAIAAMLLDVVPIVEGGVDNEDIVGKIYGWYNNETGDMQIRYRTTDNRVFYIRMETE